MLPIFLTLASELGNFGTLKFYQWLRGTTTAVGDLKEIELLKGQDLTVR